MFELFTLSVLLLIVVPVNLQLYKYKMRLGNSSEKKKKAASVYSGTEAQHELRLQHFHQVYSQKLEL